MSQPLIFSPGCLIPQRDPAVKEELERSFCRCTEMALLFRGGTGVSKDVPSHGSARANVNQVKAAKNWASIATPCDARFASWDWTSRSFGGSAAVPLKRARSCRTEKCERNALGNSIITLNGLRESESRGVQRDLSLIVSVIAAMARAGTPGVSKAAY